MTHGIDRSRAATLITIFNPAADSTVNVDPYCRIAANGCVDQYSVASLQAVEGRINGGASYPGTTYGLTWNFIALGFAGTSCYYENLLEVRVQYTPQAGGGSTWSGWAPRHFRGSGSSACSSYCPPGQAFFGARRTEAMKIPLPRFYRLSFATRRAHGHDLDFQMGGLIQRASVYLAYDVQSSTPYEAVWRDVNLPDSVGKWTLRTWSQDGDLLAELSYFRLSEHEVSAPLVFQSPKWNATSLNLLQGNDCQCQNRESSLSLHDMLLQVEPA